MHAIRSSEKALERIRASGSFPTPEPQVSARRGGRDWFGGAKEDDGGMRMRRERSRTAEITVGDSDDEDEAAAGRSGAGSRTVAEDRLRELNSAGLAAIAQGDKVRARQVLEDALTAVKRGDISDTGLAAGTYGNYGAMLLATGRDPDKAVDALADAVVRITRVPPDLQSKELELSLRNMQDVLSTALQRDTSDIRLEVISQYAVGARLERERKGFECLEHFRIANDLSKTCMGGSHPAHKAISTAFDRAKKAYAAGGTTFQSKKDSADAKPGGKTAGRARAAAGDGDLLGGGDGLGLFEKGLSNDVWSALKDAGKGKPKGVRVNAGTAAKASLADRNQLQSREGGRGASRSGKCEPSPDIFAPGPGKKSNFLANLLGVSDAQEEDTTKPKMPSISLRPGSVSDKKPDKKHPSSTRKQSSTKRDGKSSKRPMSPIQQPDFAPEGGAIKSRENRQGSIPSQQRAAPAPVARGGLREINVPVPVARNALKEISVPVPAPAPKSSVGSRVKTPTSSNVFSNRADELKSNGAASAASTAGGNGSLERSPQAQQIDSEDDSANGRCLPSDSGRSPNVLTTGQDSIDDMIGELHMDKHLTDSTERSPAAEQIHEDDRGDAAPKFFSEPDDSSKDALQTQHVTAADAAAALARDRLAAGDLAAAREAMAVAEKEWAAAGMDSTTDLAALSADAAAALARDRLAAGDLAAAREAMIVAGREWVAAGMDKTSELAALAGRLAVGLARERVGAGNIAGAQEALSTAAVEWKKAGENRSNELRMVGAEIGEAAIKMGKFEQAVDVYTRALMEAEGLDDAEAQADAYSKLSNAYELLGRQEKAMEIAQTRLEFALKKEDDAGQAAAYQALGKLCLALGRGEEAVSLFEKSMEMAEKTFDAAGQSLAQNGLGKALSSLGRNEEALQMFSQGLGLAQRAGDAVGIGIAQQGIGESYSELGQYEKAVEALKKALEMGEQCGDLGLQGKVLATLGGALTSMGRKEEADDGEMTRATMQRYDDAIELQSKALEIAEQTSDVEMQTVACRGLAVAYGALDRHAEAAEMFARALENTQESKDSAGQANVLNGLGHAYRALGKSEDAAATHMKCMELANGLGDAKLQAASYVGLAHAYKSLGRYEEAVGMMEKAEQVAQKNGVELDLLHQKEWDNAGSATLTIQCAFRMHIARRAMLAAIEGEYSKNIVRVQAAVRRSLVRSKYAQQLKRKRALLKIECTVVIQSKFRRAIANRRWAKAIDGVQVSCARVRAGYACSHRSKSNAAVALQAAERARVQRDRGAQMIEFGRRSRVSCLIQAYCRRCGPRSLHCRAIAAIILQAAARKRHAAATQAASRLVGNVSKFARAALCRRRHAQHVASTLLCAYLRAVAERSKWGTVDGAALGKTPEEMNALDRKNHEKRNCAMMRIQAAVRRVLQGKLGQAIMLESQQTDSCSYLNAVCRRRSAHDRHARLLAATYLQAQLRAIMALKRRQEGNCGALLRAACRRSVAMDAYRRCLAAMIAQAAVRRKVAGNQQAIEKSAGSKLSCSARAALSRQKHARQRHAAIKIEAVLRRRLGCARGKVQMEESLQQSTSSLLQALCRRAITRDSYARRMAARMLQAALRKCAAGRDRQLADVARMVLSRVMRAALVRRKYGAERLAVRILQAVLRRKLGHTAGVLQMNKARKVMLLESIQAACRRAIARVSYRRDLSARSLQALVRRRHACQQNMEKRFASASLGRYVMASSASRKHIVKREAAKSLQAVLRRSSGQRQGALRIDEIRRDGGAQALGAIGRRALAREAYRKGIAMLTVQAAVRRALGRDTLRRNLAASTVQAAFRRRRESQSRIESEFASDSLRQYIRAALVARQHANLRAASVVLQGCLRRSIGRSAGERRMEESRRSSSTESLQAACRQALARQTYRRTLADQTLQAVIRRARARDSHRRGTALQTVQAAIRCSQARKAYTKDIAARILQGAIRHAIAQERRNAAQNSCDALQRVVKSAVAKEKFVAQRAAAITLQASLRARRDHVRGQGKCSNYAFSMRMIGVLPSWAR